MADADVPESATGRYLVVIDPQGLTPKAAEKALDAMNLVVEDRLDFINTLVVRGSVAEARKALQSVKGVTSVEAEQQMGVQGGSGSKRVNED